MKPNRLSWLLLPFALGLGGCVTEPTPTDFQADTQTPEFKAEVAQETVELRAAGKSDEEARAEAYRRVTEQKLEAIRAQRREAMAPLLAALNAQHPPPAPPVGMPPKPLPDAWAYTLTTAAVVSGQSRAMVERFDPSQPEERLWTLLQVDGRLPTPDEHSDYGHSRVKKWKKKQEQEVENPPDPRRIGEHSNLTMSAPDAAGRVTYAFVTTPLHVALLATIPATRYSYSLVPASHELVQRGEAMLGEASLLMGAVKIGRFEVLTDYHVELPELPPVPTHSRVRVQARSLGRDTGDIILDATYSDYRRVVSYDRRFVVWIGVPTMSDFTPGDGVNGSLLGGR